MGVFSNVERKKMPQDEGPTRLRVVGSWKIVVMIVETHWLWQQPSTTTNHQPRQQQQQKRQQQEQQQQQQQQQRRQLNTLNFVQGIF